MTATGLDSKAMDFNRVRKEVTALFYKNRNERLARPMAAYMKQRFPFLGIKNPERKQLQKPLILPIKKSPQIDWEYIFELWDLPEREFQYLALDILLASKRYLRFSDLAHLEKLILSKSWWDTVDLIASHLIGEIVDVAVGEQRQVMLDWSKRDNFWIARSSILFQLKYKSKTDAALLEEIVINNSGSKEFFINKAIGWALREYSKTDKEWVRQFVRQNELHPLSRREAGKYLS